MTEFTDVDLRSKDGGTILKILKLKIHQQSFFYKITRDTVISWVQLPQFKSSVIKMCLMNAL